MFEQLTELENVTMHLEHITSIFNIMCEVYFQQDKPNEYNLVRGYTDYTNVINVIRDMVVGQKDSLNDTTDRLFNVYKELTKINEQYNSVLHRKEVL